MDDLLKSGNKGSYLAPKRRHMNTVTKTRVAFGKCPVWHAGKYGSIVIQTTKGTSLSHSPQSEPVNVCLTVTAIQNSA